MPSRPSRRRSKVRPSRAALPLSGGFTLVEVVVAIMIGGMLLLALSGVVSGALSARRNTSAVHDIHRDARFAMERMVRAVGHTRVLILPLADMPASNWRENVREETVPASPPEGSSTNATAVLAVTLPLYVDLNADGVPDADDDGDGRIDEDLPDDRNHDGAAGIVLIDDDGDGNVDEDQQHSDDESATTNDDPINGVDDDGDNNVDEDSGDDMNADACPGVCGVDDDGDGAIDEGGNGDDDEDGGSFDDWYNPVVFYLDNGTLMERMPVPWDENAAGGVTGADFVVSAIANNVSRFRIERIVQGHDIALRIDLTLELTDPASGEVAQVHTQVRVGGAL